MTVRHRLWMRWHQWYWHRNPKPVCTCYLGHQDHGEDCYCTSSIMDCAVHGHSQLGLAERETVEKYGEYREGRWVLRAAEDDPGSGPASGEADHRPG